jgi:metal-dependent hydrolase (beta-lactamase superfamily II)
MSIKLKVLPVYQGDSILIIFNDEKNRIMIDTGPRKSYVSGAFKNEIEKGNQIDLLILTHIDEDHIGGILKYFEDKTRKRNIFTSVWFNSGTLINSRLGIKNVEPFEIPIFDSENLEMSLKQGITLEKKLLEENIIMHDIIKSGDKYCLDNCDIYVLSPDIEDLKSLNDLWETEIDNQLNMAYTSDYDVPINELFENVYIEKGTIANKSSIAILFETSDVKILMMGDAYPSIIERNLRKLGYSEKNELILDIVKISHHGSSYGISPNLLGIIKCNNFIISTNGSNGLPLKECLARIIMQNMEGKTLYFNYKNEITENIFFDNEFSDYNFRVVYLSVDNNYTVSLGE